MSDKLNIQNEMSVFDRKDLLERDQWLACMDQAMTELSVDPVLRERLNASFFKTADWMRNRGV
jgi:hemoglobin